VVQECFIVARCEAGSCQGLLKLVVGTISHINPISKAAERNKFDAKISGKTNGEEREVDCLYARLGLRMR
jgi:hypothetical protein